MAPTKKATLRHSGAQEANRSTLTARVGMVVTDLSLKPLAVDRGAAAILTDSGQPGSNPDAVQIPQEVLEFVRNCTPAELSSGETHFRNGRFEYVCRTYLVEPQPGVLTQPVLVLHFERDGAASDAIHKVAAEYRLTDREQEALRGISLGLTSKELAERMHISPNTVRAFLRLIMIKMDATTRTGVLAKVLDYTRYKGA